MNYLVSYDGNDEEPYDLYLNGQKVAVVNLGEDAVMAVVEDVKNFIKDVRFNTSTTITIKNDNDVPPVGIIIDVWDGEEWVDGRTLWFDDYVD